ncbi:MAG: peptidoglycan-binding domain-containing protein, partial [bacterium]
LSSDSIWTVFSDDVSTTTTTTVTGLTNNLSYDLRVSAVNAVGQGSASSTSATPVAPPSSNSGGGSSGGGGGGGGGDVSIIYNNRPPVNNTQTCLLGQKFNITTGQACTPVNNTQTCLPGQKFNITTGQACTSFTNTNNTVQSTDSSLARELISAGIPTGFRFNKDYSVGSSNIEILYLQVFLNRAGFPVAKSGVGSKGLENKRFGPATAAALAKFQKANNITPAVGYFGKKTRNIINSKM